MSDQITYAYAGDIDKSYDEDGELIVIGKATGPDLDLDEQVCDPAWLREAMPAWMKFGNLREMHQPVAAGIGLELSAEGDDWHLKSKVVDPGTRAKIEAGALRGYSIGIKGAKVIKDAAAPGGRIVGGAVVEVSYVDRPCNPTAVTAIAKGAGLAEAVEAAEAERTYDIAKGNEMNTDANIGAEWKPEETYQDSADGATERQKDSEYRDTIQCSNCDGLGKLPETGDECPTCGGSGKVDPDEREVAGINPGTIVEGEKDADAETTKRDYTEAERESASESGAAMPGGGFPIKTVADLRNAISAIGRAKDRAATIAHIKSRAAALGRDDLIPDKWKGADADLDKVEHDPAALAAVRDSLIALIKAELDEMVAGEEDETCDVSHLMASLSIFLQWWEGESDEGETAAPFLSEDDDKEPEMDLTYLGVSADLIKSVGAGEAEPDAIKIDLIKALGIEDLREDVQTVKAAQQEEIDLLKAELERIKTLAAPGGPAITRTQAQAHKSAEAERLEAEANRYYSIAEQVEDLNLAKMYRDKADAMSRDASKIASA